MYILCVCHSGEPCIQDHVAGNITMSH